MGWLGSHNPIVRLWRRINRSVFTRAQVMVTIGDHMANVLTAHGASPRPVGVIPNWADTAFVRPIPKKSSSLAVRWGVANSLTVMYSGNIGATHGASIIADVALLLRDRPSLSFLVVGDGLGRIPLQERVIALGLSNVAFHDYQPWELLPDSLACADIALILQDSSSAALSVPSKTYNFMAAGSALLAVTAPDSDLYDLITMYSLGQAVPKPDPAAIAEILVGWLDSPKALAAMRHNARAVAEQHFSVPATEPRLRDALAPLFCDHHDN